MKFFLAFTLISLSLVAGGCSVFGNNQANNQKSQDEAQGLPYNPELEKAYEKQLAEVLRPFWESKNVDGLRDQILDLRAPARYLDLHLNLVLAIDNIQKGQISKNESAIAEGIDRVDQLAVEYKWMK